MRASLSLSDNLVVRLLAVVLLVTGVTVVLLWRLFRRFDRMAHEMKLAAAKPAVETSVTKPAVEGTSAKARAAWERRQGSEWERTPTAATAVASQAVAEAAQTAEAAVSDLAKWWKQHTWKF